MSDIVILKRASDPITEVEAIEVIKEIAESYNLRVTIGDRKRDEDQRFDVMDMTDMNWKDLDKSVKAGHLAALIDEEAGIIGYILDSGGMENVNEVLGHLNGSREGKY